MVAPADIIVELVLIVMSEVPVMSLDADRVTLPPTVSLVLTTRLPVYPVVTSDRIVAVANVIVH